MRTSKRSGGALRRQCLFVFGLFLATVAPSAHGQLIPSIDQMSYTLDGISAPYTFSEWGNVNVGFTPGAAMQYFNLNVNGLWVCKNLPVVTREGVGIKQTDSFQFDLGSALGYTRGTSRVGMNVPMGFSMTPAPAVNPGTFTNLNITPGRAVFSSGAVEATALLNAAAGPITGGAAAAPGKSHADFPNQDCEPDKCIPASVSNSLQFLKARNPGANWGALPVSIEAMVTATNWGLKTPPPPLTRPVLGCWNLSDLTRPAGERNAWWQDKNNYMISNGYPIMTMQTFKFGDILEAIGKGKDVELTGDSHTAAVVGITDLGGGSWSLQVAHDTDQDNIGGTQIDTIIFNPVTHKFMGSPGFFDGTGFQYAVIEMVPAPGSIGVLSLAGFFAVRRHRAKAMSDAQPV